MNTQTLYNKDSKGKLRTLIISANGEYLIQSSGLVGGAMVTHSKACKPKNVGRSNETTAEEQALAMMISKVKEKMTEGYCKTIEELDSEGVILPMLAKELEKESDKIDWENAYAQPKLDGMRCLKKQRDMRSRTNKEIKTVPHISSELDHIADILDGELYAHGESFQENMRLIKKNRGKDTERVKYHVYDMILDKPFSERYALLKAITADCEHIELVPTIKVTSKAELDKAHAKYLSEGYEGTILRWGTASYKINGRSSNLLKYKDFKDIALPILDFIPCESRPDWGEPVFYWKGARGHKLGDDIIGAGMRFSHEERRGFLTHKEKFKGKTAELRFFEYSESGVPRFPVMVGIRLDK